MYDVSSKNAPSKITDLFIKANDKQNHETRFSSYGKFYIRTCQNLETKSKSEVLWEFRS